MKRRMTLVSSDVTFPSEAEIVVQSPSAVEELIDAPKGIPLTGN